LVIDDQSRHLNLALDWSVDNMGAKLPTDLLEELNRQIESFDLDNVLPSFDNPFWLLLAEQAGFLIRVDPAYISRSSLESINAQRVSNGTMSQDEYDELVIALDEIDNLTESDNLLARNDAGRAMNLGFLAILLAAALSMIGWGDLDSNLVLAFTIPGFLLGRSAITGMAEWLIHGRVLKKDDHGLVHVENGRLRLNIQFPSHFTSRRKIVAYMLGYPLLSVIIPLALFHEFLHRLGVHDHNWVYAMEAAFVLAGAVAFMWVGWVPIVVGCGVVVLSSLLYELVRVIAGGSEEESKQAFRSEKPHTDSIAQRPGYPTSREDTMQQDEPVVPSSGNQPGNPQGSLGTNASLRVGEDTIFTLHSLIPQTLQNLIMIVLSGLRRKYII